MNQHQLDSTTNYVSGLRDFVRGQEQKLIDELKPLVRCQSVRLDLSSVERIDAAGLAALVSLYRAAREAGHVFAVVNPSRRAARIIALAGLDRVLMPKDPEVSLPLSELRLDLWAWKAGMTGLEQNGCL